MWLAKKGGFSNGSLQIGISKKQLKQQTSWKLELSAEKTIIYHGVGFACDCMASYSDELPQNWPSSPANHRA